MPTPTATSFGPNSLLHAVLHDKLHGKMLNKLYGKSRPGAESRQSGL